MASGELAVTPEGLGDASAVVEGHAGQVASAAGSLTGSAELAGVAAGAAHAAFDGFCGAFSQRLCSVSGALVGAASSFTAMENTNGQALARIAPGGYVSVSEV